MITNTRDLWIVDDVVAHVDNGEVTISIDRPTRSLPKEKAERVADGIWLEGQLRKLDLARSRRETIDIPLTDRLRRSSLRLGGGFIIVQGKRLLLIRRSNDARRRASQLCECGGVYEVLNADPHDSSNDFIASLLKECAEVALVRGERVYAPVLAISTPSLGFQPPGMQISEYDSIVFMELKEEIESAKLPVYHKTGGNPDFTKFHASILNYERSVKLQFADSPAISVDFTAELDTSSLEFVGVLGFPDDLDLAAMAYLEEKTDEKSKEALKILRNEYNETDRSLLEYWDTERIDQQPLNRDILLIDIENGKTQVWYTPRQSSHGKPIPPDSKDRTREYRNSFLWSELSRTHLAATGGRHTTEKAEKAIKMHSPLPLLQPLITL